MGMLAAYSFTAVLSKFHPSDYLLVNKVCCNVVFSWVVPGAEDLFPVEQPPGGIPLLGALLLCVLLTLWDSVHDMVAPAAQRRHLKEKTSFTSDKPDCFSDTSAWRDSAHRAVSRRWSGCTLSNRAMYSEKPKRSLRLILSASALQSSLAVVAESARRVFVVPSMNVTGSMMGFLDFVAWRRNKSDSSSSTSKLKCSTATHHGVLKALHCSIKFQVI